MERSGHVGRPRDPHLGQAIIAAAREVFLERGYRSASLTEIARRAGVATPAIYRRWHGKADIAIEIMRTEQVDQLPDSGDLEADLAMLVRHRIRTWSGPFYRRIVLGLLVDGQVDEELAAHIRAAVGMVRNPFFGRLKQAIDSGELDTDATAEEVLDQIMGPLILRLVFLAELPDEGEAEEIVARGLRGVAGGRRDQERRFSIS